MPRLPSGKAFAIGQVLDNSADVDPKKYFSCLHVMQTAKDRSDLYLALPVIQFGHPSEATGPVVDKPIPEGLPDGTVAYDPGISFLEFYEMLEEKDKVAAREWISDSTRRNFLFEQLLSVVRRRRESDYEHPLYSSRKQPRFDIDIQEVFTPKDIAVYANDLFPDEAGDWCHYSSDSGFLRLRPRFKTGLAGPQGTLALGNPPTLEDVDAWEASKPSGVWDYWSFLAFQTLPIEKPPFKEIILFFEGSSFFDRPFELVKRFEMDTVLDDTTSGKINGDSCEIEREWHLFFQSFSKHIRVASLDNEVWRVGEKTFNSNDPDQ